jgi:hypothetical protein
VAAAACVAAARDPSPAAAAVAEVLGGAGKISGEISSEISGEISASQAGRPAGRPAAGRSGGVTGRGVKRRPWCEEAAAAVEDGIDGEMDRRVWLHCCAEGQWDYSVLSDLRNGWDSIEREYEQPIFRFFTMKEACELRLVCREFEDAISITPFRKLTQLIRPHRLPAWQACFPNAEVWEVLLSRQNLGSSETRDLAAIIPSMLSIYWILYHTLCSGSDTVYLQSYIPLVLVVRLVACLCLTKTL